MRIPILTFALTLIAPSAVAQSIVSGGITGTVLDELGRPMLAGHVVITEVSTGLQRERETGANGRFDVLFLPPGTYEVFAEQLGYRPTRVRGIPVAPGSSTLVPISLTPAPPPVDSVEVVEFVGGTFGLTGPSSSRRFSALDLGGLPDRTREFAELGRFASVTLGTLGTEGLPGRFAGIVIDGVPYAGAVHPGLPGSAFSTASFAFSQFSDAELLTNGVDVEYAGFAGASLTGRTVRGTQRLEARGFGDWAGERGASSDHFDPRAVSHNTLRGGVLITGPVIRDTAYFVLGVEARRLETPLPRAWTATGLDSALLAVASDSFGVDLGGYVRPRLVTTDLISSFGRFDGQISKRSAFTLRANFARLFIQNPHVASPFVGLGARLDGTDVNGAAHFTSSVTAGIGVEFRLALEYSEREYRSSDLPATVLAEGPVAFGDDPALPGRFERVAIRASETIHFQLGTHQLKLGGSMVAAFLDQGFAIGREGEFAFGGVNDFAAVDGSFVQSVGLPPSARFTTTEFGGFMQDSWRPVPGLEMTLGFRIDAEFLPNDEVSLNTAWLERTALSNSAFDRTITKFSPRFGVRWDVGNRHRWLVRAQAGVHFGTVDPGTFAEVIEHSGNPLVRRGIGSLGRWVETPDSNVAPERGPSLTLPGTNFEAPRTFRTSFGLSRALGSTVTLDVSAAYRHTDFLPRRHDLNLIAAPSGQDQFGRPVYGTLIQRGSVLVSEPGSNRRFPEFDLVSSLDADGVSDYWGLTARLERRVGRVLNFDASYTYSRTDDNLLLGRGPGVQLTPFPAGLNNEDWSDSRSDFDVPHRVAVGAELKLAMFRLAGFYRRQSGFPFTPGFRDGVDANGDGSSSNDPAFIDDGIPDVANLLSKWDCLRAQVGRFAKRNSCRSDPMTTLDVRLTVRLFAVEIVADGLNLLDSNVAIVDRALYLVDASRTLVTDPVTGGITVPLVANPNFGRAAYSFATGRLIRLGVRVGS